MEKDVKFLRGLIIGFLIGGVLPTIIFIIIKVNTPHYGDTPCSKSFTCDASTCNQGLAKCKYYDYNGNIKDIQCPRDECYR